MKCCKHWPSSVPLPVTPKIWSAYILPLTCYTYPSKSVWGILIKIASSHFAWRIYSFKTPMRVKKVNIKYSLCDVKKKLKLSVFLSYFILFMYFFNRKSHNLVPIEILAFLSSKSFYIFAQHTANSLYTIFHHYIHRILQVVFLIDSHWAYLLL